MNLRLWLHKRDGGIIEISEPLTLDNQPRFTLAFRDDEFIPDLTIDQLNEMEARRLAWRPTRRMRLRALVYRITRH